MYHRSDNGYFIIYDIIFFTNLPFKNMIHLATLLATCDSKMCIDITNCTIARYSST